MYGYIFSRRQEKPRAVGIASVAPNSQVQRKSIFTDQRTDFALQKKMQGLVFPGISDRSKVLQTLMNEYSASKISAFRSVVQKEESADSTRDDPVDSNLESQFDAGEPIEKLPSVEEIDEIAEGADTDVDDPKLQDDLEEDIGTIQPVLQAAKMVSYFRSPYARFARRRRRQHKTGGCNLATIKMIVNGVLKYKTFKSQGYHSEKLIYDHVQHLRNVQNKVVNVLWIYTELQPCGSDCHNCSNRLKGWFPGVKIRYSISYTNSTKIPLHNSGAIAKRRRGRAVKVLKRFETRLRSGQPKPNSKSDFKPKLVRVNSDPALTKGFLL